MPERTALWLARTFLQGNADDRAVHETEQAGINMLPFKNHRVAEILAATLCGSSETSTARLWQYLTSPPHISTLRINTLTAKDVTIKSKLEEYLHQIYEDRTIDPPLVSTHPLFSDILLLKSASEGNPASVVPAETAVIVGLGCGLAVMRGADIYAPGIMGTPYTLKPGQLVAVYADLHGLCLRGFPRPFESPTVFCGNGISLISREDIFNTATPSGLAVKMTDPVYDSPSLGNCMPNVFFLQNLPSILCGHVLNPQPGELILDMCAAPGGKTTHLAALMKNQGQVIALDRSRSKIKQIESNVERFGLVNVAAFAFDSTKAVDVAKKAGSSQLDSLEPRFAPQTFDKILLDAPCSALGQRPQLANPITPKELESYPKVQRKLFAAAVQLLKPGGKLVYSTCTLTPAENEGIVAWALKNFPELELIPALPNARCQCKRPYPISPEDLNPVECEKVLRFHPQFDSDAKSNPGCDFCLSIFWWVTVHSDAVPLTNGSCYLEANPETPSLVAAGSVTLPVAVLDCVGGCADLNFLYAATDGNTTCLCGKTAAETGLTVATVANCTSTGVAKGYYTVYTAGSLVFSNLTASLAASGTNSEVVTVTATVDIAAGVNITYDYGDGSPETPSSSHTYIAPRSYTITVKATDGSKELYFVLSHSFVVPGKALQALCPPFAAVGDEYSCQAVITGSSSSLTVTFPSPLTYTAPGPAWDLYGNLPPTDPSTSVSTSTATNVLLRSFVVNSGIAQNVAFWAAATGTYTFVVAKPVCASGTQFCLQDGKCRASCTGSTIATCAAPQYLCSGVSRIGACAVDTDTTCPAAGAVPTSFTDVSTVSLTVASTGPQNFNILSQATVWLDPGTFVGLRVPSAGSLGVKTGEPADYEDSVLGGNQAYLMVSASPVANLSYNSTCGGLSTSTFSYTLDATKSNATVCQMPVVLNDVLISDNVSLSPTLVVVATGDVTTFTTSFFKGGPVYVSIDYGDGTKDPKNLTGPVNITSPPLVTTHVYTTPGAYVVNVTAWNEYGLILGLTNNTRLINVLVQEPAKPTWTLVPSKTDFFLTTENASFTLTGPVLNYPTNSTVYVDWNDGVVKTNMTLESYGPTNSSSYTLVHTYAKVGVFNISGAISNYVSRENFTATVEILAFIKNLTAALNYITPTGKVSPPMGINKDQVPTNYDTTFTLSVLDGTVEYYTVYNITSGPPVLLGDYTVPDRFSPNGLVYPFNLTSEGNQTFLWSAFNSLQPYGVNYTITFTVVGKVRNPKIDDFFIVTSEYLNKSFKITFDSVGSGTCMKLDYGDGHLEAYGEKWQCDKVFATIPYKDMLLNDMTVRRNYTKRGNYNITLVATGMDVEVSYVLPFVIAPDASCVPPLTYIPVNHTDFSEPRVEIRSAVIEFTGAGILNCTRTQNTLKQWFVQRVNETSGKDLDSIDISSLASRSFPTLIIPTNFLTYGLYKVTYKLTMSDPVLDPAFPLTRWASTYLKIEPSPLVGIMIQGGGSKILRGGNQTVLLQPGVFSLDPDYPDDKTFDITWFCRQKAPIEESLTVNDDGTDVASGQGTSGGGCYGYKPGKLNFMEPEFSDLASKFIAFDVTYELVALVTKDTRATRAIIEVAVVPNPAPVVVIECLNALLCHIGSDATYINPGVRLAVVGICYDYCISASPAYLWIAEHKDDTGVVSSLAAKLLSNSQGVNTAELAIQPALFVGFTDTDTLILSLNVTDPGSPIPGQTQFFLKLNQPPSDGTCTSNGTSLRSLIDQLTVSCDGWTDPESKGVSKYSIYSTDASGTKKALTSGTLFPMALILSPGVHALSVEIVDTWGAIATFNITPSVTVTVPNETEYEAFMASGAFQQMSGAGNTDLLLMAMQAQISVQTQAPWSAVTLNSNMTEDERNAALMSLSQQKQQQLDMLLASSSFSTVQQLNAGSGTLAAILSGTKAEGDEALALDLGVRQSALNALQAMAAGAANVEVATPQELVPFVTQMAGAMGSLMEGVTNVVGSGDLRHLPPGDLAKGDKMFYDTDAGDDLYMQVPKDPDVQMRGNILDSTKNQAGAIIPSLLGIASQLERTLLSLMVVPEAMQISSDNNVTLTAQLRPGDALKNGTTISLGAANASVSFPPGFCPYANISVNGSCPEPFGVAASCWPALGHSFVKTSNLVSKDSFTLDINLLDRSMNKLDVENANPPITLNIPRRENSLSRLPNATTVDVKKAMAEAVNPIAYSMFLVERPNMTITIEITPGSSNQTLVLLLSRERMPTLNKANHIIFVPQLNQTSKGTYTWNLALSSPQNTTGRWFIGVLEVKVPSYPAVPLSAISTGANVNPLGSLTVSSFSTNYKLRVFTSGCFFFNETENAWTTNGLTVGAVGMQSTGCSSSHLSVFGSGFFVKPNTVDFSYVFAHASFTDNITIYVTIIVTFTVYVSLLIWARYKDKKDLETLGATPLPDNKPEDKYVYEILVFTGDQADAATDSKVQFILTGDDEDSGARTFGDTERKIFRKGQTDSFVMACPRPLGSLMYLRIWHDNSGKGRYASWYLSFIVVRDVQTQQKSIFIADNWFAVEEEDGKIDRILPVAGQAQMTDFKHLFSKTSTNKLRDGHLWFSVFLRPPRSRFTRVERLSSCMALLYLSMLVNAMWYGTVPPSNGRGFSLGPVTLTPQQIFVGLASNLIVFPPSFLIVLLFRKSKPRKLRPSRIDNALVKSGSALTKSQMLDEYRKEKAKERRKKTFLLPWWCRYIAWVLVAGSIGVSIFFLWAYGIQFGNEKTTQWLTSLVVSFFSSVLLVQPVKVIITALFISMMCPSMNSDIDDADLDEEDPSLAADEELLHGSRHFRNGRQRARYSPFDQAFIERLREARLKEIKMWEMFRQVFSYVFFLSVLLILAYDNRDSNSHLQYKNLYNTFVVNHGFDKVQTTNDWWTWANGTLLTEMQAPFWYNGKSPYGQRGFLKDRVNRVLGYAFLRQIRVLPNTCRVQPVMQKVADSCAEFSTLVDEDTNNYCSYWVPPSMRAKTTPKPGVFSVLSAANCSAKEFKYKKASEISELPLVGKLDAYSGGGYVLRISGSSTTVSRTMGQALEANWIDKRTRAVIMHFSTYNVQVNLFSVITLMAEFAPSGNIVPSWTIDVVRLIHTDETIFVVGCQFVYMCFIIYFTVREIMKMCKQKKSYFKKYWSYGDWATILASYGGMVLYILRYRSTMEALDEFEKTWGNGYINLRYVDTLDAVYSYLMAFVCFLSILKVLQLLNFNPRMLLLEETLRYAAEDLVGYFIMFFVIFFAFTQLFYLLLCNNVHKFWTLWSATQYTLCASLGVFNYNEAVDQSKFIPYIYAAFSFCIVHVLINVLFTIIMAAFAAANENSEKRAQDLDFVNYLASRIKAAMGLLSKNNRVGPKAPVPPSKSVKDLPMKVDQFVASINSLYFSGQLDTGPPAPAVGGSRQRY